MAGDDPHPLGTTPDEQQLRELVEHAKQDLPSSTQLNGLASRLGPILAGSALVAASSATGVAAGKGAAAAAQATLGATALKVGGAAVLAATIAGGTYWAASNENPPPPAPRAMTATRVAPPPRASVSPEPKSSKPEAAPTALPEAPSSTPAPRARSAPTAPRPPDEAALLRRAQAQLNSDPARALALTQEHRRRFPKGVLAQEREVIAIDALARLGQADEAQKRARDFDERYPGSAHQRRIESATKHGQ